MEEIINKAILMGRMTRDPELRNTNSGASVCNFSVAVDDGYGENKTTSFINCIAWNKTAEFVSNYFSKGKMIIVVGRIQSRSWDGQDGRKNYTTEVVAQEVSFGESKRNEGEANEKYQDFSGFPKNFNGVDFLGKRSGDGTGGSFDEASQNGASVVHRDEGIQQRMDDMMNNSFTGLNDEDNDLPF